MHKIYNFFKTYKYPVFLFVSLIILFLGFYSNFYKISPKYKFDVFETYSESLIVGRLNMSRQSGVFSYGGLTGWIQDLPKDKTEFLYKGYKSNNSTYNTIFYQYETYNKNLDFDSQLYKSYDSQTGGQAMLFSIIDLFRSKEHRTLNLFWIITSLLSAFVFSLFLLWVKKTFNLLTALIALFFIVCSVWITWFGKNLWWSLWSFYVPFLCLSYFFIKNPSKNLNILLRQVFLVSLASFFAKCFFTGFEYITTTCIMGFIPVLFYWIYQSWSFKKFFKIGISVTLGSLTAILTSFCVLAFQISKIKGSLAAGFQHIVYSFNKRTSGNVSSNAEKFHENAQEATSSEVLQSYFNGFAFDFNVYVDTKWKSLLIIDFGELILIFIICSVLLFHLSKNNTFFVSRKKTNALLITTWVSILAPLSWLVIFKQHSYIHTHMNFIVWYMPFALLGFVIVAIVIYHYAIKLFSMKVVKDFFKHRKAIYISASCAVAICILLLLRNNSNDLSGENHQNEQNTSSIEFDNNFESFSIDKLIELSADLYKKEEYKASLKVAKQIVTRDSLSYIGYNNICANYIKLQEYDLAREACEKSVQLKPDFKIALNSLKNIAKLTKKDLSIPTLESLIRVEPTENNYLKLTYSYYNVKAYDKCLELCKDGLKKYPNSFGLYNNMCISEIEKGNFEAAKEACEKGLKINPNNETLQRNLKKTM